MGRAKLVVAAAVAALVVAGAAQADKVHYNASDLAAAKKIVLTKADLGTAWKGGATKPDLSSADISCASYHPKTTGLVATGAAETDFTAAGGQVDSEAEIMQTAAMVHQDFSQSITPAALPCLKQTFAKEAAKSGKKLVSAARLAVPHVTPMAAGFRIVLSETSQGTTVPVLLDVLFFGKGRTEVDLSVTAPAAEKSSVTSFEARLGRLLARRITR